MAGAAEGPAASQDPDWEQQLGCLLTLYAGTTRTWEAAGRFKNGGHFIVLNYRRTGARDGRLRPFAVADSQRVLPAAELKSMIADVVAVDRARHPEWFSNSG